MTDTTYRIYVLPIKFGVNIANGQMARCNGHLLITNEIERRYCPIQNQCHPHCDKAKIWRDEYLNYGHKPKDVDQYYQDRYLQESNLDD